MSFSGTKSASPKGSGSQQEDEQQQVAMEREHNPDLTQQELGTLFAAFANDEQSSAQGGGGGGDQKEDGQRQSMEEENTDLTQQEVQTLFDAFGGGTTSTSCAVDETISASTELSYADNTCATGLNMTAQSSQQITAAYSQQDQPPPSFTVEDEQAELATLTVEEIISVEKDLRGVQAGLGNMTLEDGGTNQEQPPAAKKKKRGRKGTPPPYDAVEATDVDIAHLDAELGRLGPSLKAAYLEACLKCPAEAQSRDRKAAFLEREDLNPSRAALRLVSYWQLRLGTFGPDRAFLPMTIDGAIRDEVADMTRHCVIHVLPYTDGSGRAIFFFDPSGRNLAKFPLDREGRVLFYLIDSLTTDPIIRRAGFVGLVDYRNVSRSQISAKQQRFMRSVFEAMPIRCRACHICHPGPVLAVVYPVLKYILGRELRLRTRLHTGTDRDVLDQLEACSLPRRCLPRELGGDLTLNVAQWVANRSIVETTMALKEAENERRAPVDSAEDDAKPAASSHIGTTLDVAFMQGLGRNDNMSIDLSTTRRTTTSLHSSDNAVGDQFLLTGEEARRAVVGNFIDELVTIGDGETAERRGRR